MKRTIAFALTLIVAFSAIIVPAYADNSEAGIDFILSIDPPILITPPDEGDPDDGLFDNIYNRGIYFGEWSASAVTVTYDSRNNGVADQSTKYVGAIVENSNLGIDWKLQVSIGNFRTTIGDNINLENFTLTFSPDTDSSVSNIAQKAIAETVVLRANESSVTILGAGSERVGRFGQNWWGELTVPVGSVKHTGESVAVMNWILVAAAV